MLQQGFQFRTLASVNDDQLQAQSLRLAIRESVSPAFII
jgi:hypothetical protein